MTVRCDKQTNKPKIIIKIKQQLLKKSKAITLSTSSFSFGTQSDSSLSDSEWWLSHSITDRNCQLKALWRGFLTATNGIGTRPNFKIFRGVCPRPPYIDTPFGPSHHTTMQPPGPSVQIRSDEPEAYNIVSSGWWWTKYEAIASRFEGEGQWRGILLSVPPAYDTFFCSLRCSHYEAATFREADNGKEQITLHFWQLPMFFFIE